MKTRLVALTGVFLLLFGFGPVKAYENTKNLLVIGRSLLASSIGLDLLVGALIESNKTPMNVERAAFGPRSMDQVKLQKRLGLCHHGCLAIHPGGGRRAAIPGRGNRFREAVSFGASLPRSHMKLPKTTVPMCLVSAICLTPAVACAEGVGAGKLDGAFFLVGAAFFIGLIAIPAMALVSLRLNKHLNAQWMTAWSLVNAILAAVLVNLFVVGFLFQSPLGFMLVALLVLSFLSVSTALLVQWRLIHAGRHKSLKPTPPREGAA